MVRTLKGTRARGLPPKLLLSRKQDATGSFPTVWRTASDNRTGKYPVFFNDNKVVRFNQPVTDSVGITVSTYPQYEEQIVTVGSPGNPANSAAVSYSYPFTGVPMVVLTEITPNAGTPTVNAFLIGSTVNGIIIGFSAPFEGTIVYRAVFLSSPGQPVNVVRSPRFADQYSLVVNQGAVLAAENNAFLTFSDFGSVPAENYVTFFDFYANNQADISASITYITNTSVQVTASATATNVLYYMGVSTASIDVTGIVYPLVMTPQAINAGLSQQDKTDLYKQPYFSGSSIVNQPIVASGSMVKGVSDLFVTFTPGQDIEPFIDYENPEVDAKLTNNSFFATGSAVTTTGLGFQQPLWSKNKLEIDLDVSIPVTFGQSTDSDEDKLMVYYDFAQKTYVPIGDTKANNQLRITTPGQLAPYFEKKSIGFGQSVRGFFGLGVLLGSPLFEILSGKTFAAPINSFGFPYDHKRYGVGNNGVTNNTNMLLPLNDLISEPFLLEKIVLEFTGAMSSSGTDDSGFSAMSTFFILNQSATNFFQTSSTNQFGTFVYNYSATPPHIGVGPGYVQPTLFVTESNYNIDLVTYAQISALTSSVQNNNLFKSLYERDLNIYQEAQTPVQNSYGINPDFGYSGSFILSSSVKSSYNFESGTSWFKNYATIPGPFNYTCFTLLANKGGRKNLTQPCGRNWKASLPANIPPFYIPAIPIPFYENSSEPNPYILLPTDKLIIGWQAPFGNISGSIAGNCGDISQMHFPAGKGKLILYGSTLRLNPETNQLEEYHDTLNQLLSSNSIHEVIGE